MRCVLLIGVVLFGLSTARAAEEAEIKKLLPGTWVSVIEQGGAKIESETEYKADGTQKAKAVATLPNGKKIEILVEGTWAVKGSTVESAITKSNHPSAKVGPASPDEIIEITDKVKKHKNTKGEIMTETRK